MKFPRALTSRQKALKITEFIKARKAKDIVILDMRKVSNLCDYFIICSAESSRQVKGIEEAVIKESKKSNIEIQHCEADELPQWVLVDFFDIILHIFLEETRNFYNLEYLWSSAKKVKLTFSSR